MSITDKNKVIPPNEGELKKRISNAEVKDIDEVFHPYTIVNIKDVLQILDIAAKEFPFRDDVLGISTRKIRKGGKLNFEKDLRTPTIEDAKAWFKKFFGDATP